MSGSPPPLVLDSLGSSTSLHPEFDEGIDETLELLTPTPESDQTRKWVFQHLENIVNSIRGVIQVFQYGSSANRTYLPDSDIDVGAFLYPDSTEEFFPTLLKALQNRQQASKSGSSSSGKPVIKDVTFISSAQVKVVKCNIGGVSVDTSVNTVNARATVFFLEEVDRTIDRLLQRKHLFKRSVILVKAWCVYEGRIQGSDTGLLSSFAISTMVLYIFNVYHAQIHSPFHVLYFFLKVYSSFNFQSECITVRGPITLASIYRRESIYSEPPDPLFSDQFWTTSSQRFYTAPNTPTSYFETKFFNIMDPLNPHNNIGRSVSKDHSHFISEQLKKGWAQLQQGISSLPSGIPRATSAHTSIRTESDTKHKEPSPEEAKESKEKLDPSSDQLPESPPLVPSASQTSPTFTSTTRTIDHATRFQYRRNSAKNFIKSVFFKETWRKYGSTHKGEDEKAEKCTRPDVSTYMDLFGVEEPKRPDPLKLQPSLHTGNGPTLHAPDSTISVPSLYSNSLEKPSSPRRRSLPPGWDSAPRQTTSNTLNTKTFFTPEPTTLNSLGHSNMDLQRTEPRSRDSVTEEPRMVIKQNSVELIDVGLGVDREEEKFPPHYSSPGTGHTSRNLTPQKPSSSSKKKPITPILTRSESERTSPEKKAPSTPTKEKDSRDSCFGLLGAWSRPVVTTSTKYEPSPEREREREREGREARSKAKEDEPVRPRKGSSSRSLATEKDDGRRDSIGSDTTTLLPNSSLSVSSVPESVSLAIDGLRHPELKQFAKKLYLEKQELTERVRVLEQEVDQIKKQVKVPSDSKSSKVGDSHKREIDDYINKIGMPPPTPSFAYDPRFGVFPGALPVPHALHSPPRKPSLETPQWPPMRSASPPREKDISPSHAASSVPKPSGDNGKTDGDISQEEEAQFESLRQQWNASRSGGATVTTTTIPTYSQPGPAYFFPATQVQSYPWQPQLQTIPQFTLQQPTVRPIDNREQLLQLLQYGYQFSLPPTQYKVASTYPPPATDHLRKSPITRSLTASPSTGSRFVQ